MADSESSEDVPLRSLAPQGARVVDPMEDSSDDDVTPRGGAAGRGGRAEVAAQGGSADGTPPAPAPRRREASPTEPEPASLTEAPRTPTREESGASDEERLTLDVKFPCRSGHSAANERLGRRVQIFNPRHYKHLHGRLGTTVEAKIRWIVVELDDVDSQTKKQRFSFEANQLIDRGPASAGVQVAEVRSYAERHLGNTPEVVRKGRASPTVAARPPSPDFSGVHPDVAKDPKYADFAADLKNKVPADKMRWPDPLARDTP